MAAAQNTIVTHHPDGTTTWEDAIAKVKEDNPKPE